MNTQLQKIFSHTVPKLLKQNEQAYSLDNGSCLYRLYGLKCLIGMCITDEAFDVELAWNQDKPASSLVVRQALTDSGFPNETISNKDIQELQLIHDHYNSPDKWPELFRSYATRHGLQYPEQEVAQ